MRRQLAFKTKRDHSRPQQSFHFNYNYLSFDDCAIRIIPEAKSIATQTIRSTQSLLPVDIYDCELWWSFHYEPILMIFSHLATLPLSVSNLRITFQWRQY